jgi:transcription antitermination factor NusG
MEEKILKEGMNWYVVRTMNNVENKVKELKRYYLQKMGKRF